MISYTEKGYGLHERIRAAGQWLVDAGGVWQASDDALVQTIIDAYTVADAAAYACAQIDAHAKALRDRVVADVSPGEMAAWPLKLAEARAYAASGNAADAPLLAAEAALREVPIADILARVGGNAARLSTLETRIAGTAGRHKDRVRAEATFAAVLAYDWTAGWPEV